MVNKFLQIINKYKNVNRKLVTNFLSLSVLEAVNYLVPILLIPYTIKIFGVEKFGEYMFAQAFVQYFSTVVDLDLISLQQETFQLIKKIEIMFQKYLHL